jgi:hypothetical protein
MKEITLPKSKHKYGYTAKEVEAICKQYKVPMKEYNKKFGVNTCALHPKTNETLYYGCDIIRTISMIKENRDMYYWEWD